MAATIVPPRSDTELAGLLDSPKIADLIRELEATRWTGRKGYPIRAMVGMALAKSLYSLPTWTRTVALVSEHAALREAIGGETPSVYACYRFTAKLRKFDSLLQECISRVLARLHAEHPEMGQDVAIDGSDLPVRARERTFGGADYERRATKCAARPGSASPPPEVRTRGSFAAIASAQLDIRAARGGSNGHGAHARALQQVERR